MTRAPVPHLAGRPQPTYYFLFSSREVIHEHCPPEGHQGLAAHMLLIHFGLVNLTDGACWRCEAD